MDYVINPCPHCGFIFQVYKSEFNCRIFRCGVTVRDLKQIPPHLDKQTCEYLASNNFIFGCAKPFTINDKSEFVVCDYI